DTDISRRASHFKELVNLIKFQSCMGFPVYVFGERSHVIFYLYTEAKGFTKSNEAVAVASPMILGSILEAIAIDDQLKSINPIIIQGELTGRLSHEIRGLQNRLLNQVELLRREFPESRPLNTLLKNVQNAIATVNTIESFR